MIRRLIPHWLSILPKRNHRRSAAFWLSVLVCCGCGQVPYEMAPVSGKVTLDGQPLPGAIVNFQPLAAGDSQNPGPGSTGKCDEAGRFVLENMHREPGAVVANHRVRIYSPKSSVPSAQDVDLAPQVERIPPQYNYRSTLEFRVPPGGTDVADFELVTSPAG